MKFRITQLILPHVRSPFIFEDLNPMWFLSRRCRVSHFLQKGSR